MYTPPSAALKTSETERTSFAEDVEYYLSQIPRQLPSRYFYDSLGSALFDAICQLPWYRITRTEQRLLDEHAADIFARAGSVATLIELGPGGGEKLGTLVSARPRTDLEVILVDVSPAALDAARRALGVYPELLVEGYQAVYDAGLAEFARRPRATGTTLALCLGSNIGNFDPPDADAFLQRIRAALLPGDSLLLGADLVKPVSDLLLAYDDPLGVTAAFNLNLLARANSELGADFDLDAFAHRAIWNTAMSRIEMHLVSLRRQVVRVPAASGIEVTFDEGETIWTESSYKYRAHELIAMLERAGFATTEQWHDEGFALTLGEAR